MAYADVSLASTSVANPVFGAPTTFNFSSGNDGGYASSGENDQSSRTDASATAALGNANSATGPGSSATQTNQTGTPFSLSSIPTTYWVIGGAGLVLILGLVILLRK